MKSFTQFFGLRTASPVASGLYWSGIWLALGAIVLSILLMGTTLSESNLLPWVLCIHGFASLSGGFVAAKRSGRRGWYFGMTNGILYTVILLMISFLATDARLSVLVPALLGITSLAGALGGMLGVNAGANNR